MNKKILIISIVSFVLVDFVIAFFVLKIFYIDKQKTSVEEKSNSWKVIEVLEDKTNSWNISLSWAQELTSTWDENAQKEFEQDLNDLLDLASEPIPKDE